jgi:hypothetical protein
MPYVTYDPSKASLNSAPSELRFLVEGIRMTFPPYKPLLVSESQWRYLKGKQAPSHGLILFDVNDDVMSDVLEERATKAKGDAEAKGPKVEAPAPAPDGATPYEAAEAIKNWSDFRAFAKQHLGPKIPRTRDAIMSALKELDS